MSSDEALELEGEIKKVWDIADQNGDGSIDAKELSGVAATGQGKRLPSPPPCPSSFPPRVCLAALPLLAHPLRYYDFMHKFCTTF